MSTLTLENKNDRKNETGHWLHENLEQELHVSDHIAMQAFFEGRDADVSPFQELEPVSKSVVYMISSATGDLLKNCSVTEKNFIPTSWDEFIGSVENEFNSLLATEQRSRSNEIPSFAQDIVYAFKSERGERKSISSCSTKGFHDLFYGGQFFSGVLPWLRYLHESGQAPNHGGLYGAKSEPLLSLTINQVKILSALAQREGNILLNADKEGSTSSTSDVKLIRDNVCSLSKRYVDEELDVPKGMEPIKELIDSDINSANDIGVKSIDSSAILHNDNAVLDAAVGIDESVEFFSADFEGDVNPYIPWDSWPDIGDACFNVQSSSECDTKDSFSEPVNLSIPESDFLPGPEFLIVGKDCDVGEIKSDDKSLNSNPEEYFFRLDVVDPFANIKKKKD